MRSYATTNDARYAPGMEMISETINLKSKVEALEERLDFYKTMYFSALQQLDELEAALRQERRCVADAYHNGLRAGRREKDPYLIKIKQVNIY